MRGQKLCFIIPAHGRLAIAEVCFKQLRRTCDSLGTRGITADAVVIADDENLELAQANGFATVERDNDLRGRKLNDGYQLAGEYGADFFVPFGSDDWIDPEWISVLPSSETVMCTHLSAVVNEDGTRMSRLHLTYPGGDGVRIYPRALIEACGFRPVGEDRKRALDASTNSSVTAARNFRHAYHDTHPLCIVDFKSADNLNDYKGCHRKFGQRYPESKDVWGDLAAIYPADSIAEMQAVYGMVRA